MSEINPQLSPQQKRLCEKLEKAVNTEAGKCTKRDVLIAVSILAVSVIAEFPTEKEQKKALFALKEAVTKAVRENHANTTEDTSLLDELYYQICDVVDSFAGRAELRDALTVLAAVAAELLKQQHADLQDQTLQVFLEDVAARASALQPAETSN